MAHKTPKSVVEHRLIEILDTIKGRIIVSVKDLEEFSEVVSYVHLKIEELRKSRDNWRKKYEEIEDLHK